LPYKEVGHAVTSIPSPRTELRVLRSSWPVFPSSVRERELCIDNLLVRIHFNIVMIRWTGLAPWGFHLMVLRKVVEDGVEGLEELPSSVTPNSAWLALTLRLEL